MKSQTTENVLKKRISAVCDEILRYTRKSIATIERVLTFGYEKQAK